MCGICGFYGFEDKALIKKMADSISHRGPDDSGYFFDKNVTLGHRRLSIIDLGGGHQPIHNEDESVWIVFNGEIYNYKELRSVLEEKGHRFYTNTDTEVIVHAYEEYGTDCVKKFNGMFAYAIWDSIKKTLILARDPLGEKPLYYYMDESKFIFASEIKAILEANIPKDIDLGSLSSYIAYQYVLGTKTMFKEIKKLLAGHLLIIKNNVVKTTKYWDIQEKISFNDELTLIKKLRDLLEKSAKYRIIADVPVGAFLSGGIDSSAVVALTKPHIDYEFHTISLGFENYSESSYAKTVSEYLNTTHHEITITSKDVIKNINKIAWHYDEPIGDAAIINNYFLSKYARKYVKVVVAGEAGDELFAGYPNYQINLKYYNYFKIPTLSSIIKNSITISPKKGNIYKNRIERLLTRFAQPNFETAHLHTTRILNDDEIKELTHLKSENIEQNAIYPQNIEQPLNKMLALDCKNLLPEKFLMKADKATMANSVEERLPLMDKNVVEFAFSIPPNLKLRGNQDKYILRMAVKDLLPREIVYRKKHGFSTPVDIWITKEIKSVAIQTLKENELIKQYFKADKINKIIENINCGNTSRSRVTWTIFALGLWHDVYFK